jgi:hypothetical protein
MTELGMQGIKSYRAILAFLMLAAAAQAKDLELSLSLGSGYPVKPNLYLNGQGTSGTSTFVQTRFTGPWLLGGAHLHYEVYKVQAWKFWAGAGYEAGLGSPAYYKLGQSTYQAATSSTEILDGSAKYSRYQVGLGATLATGTLGEYGVYLWRRVNRISLDGTLNTFQLQGTALGAQTASYATRATASDFMLEATMGFVQARPTFKTFERIGLGSAFGPAFGTVGAGNWQLDPAFNDRLRPTLELSFSFGVRL